MASAGWKPGRSINTEAEELALRLDGYAIWPGLVEFLREFSGLSFRADAPKDVIWFDAHRAARLAFPENARLVGEKMGIDTAPIGYARSDHLMLLAGSDGRFWGAFDDYVEPLGGSAMEMLESLLGDRPIAPW